MTLGARIAWDDTVLPFQLDRSGIRGRVVRLDGVLSRVLEQHAYPARAEALLAETLTLTALIGPLLKLRWKLSLQVRGTGAARLLATDYRAPESPGGPARLRGYASFDAARLEGHETPFDALGSGYFALLIDQGAGTTPYQGITPLASGTLAACAESYFAQSEQLPTRFALAFGHDPQGGWRAGGIVLQLMPRASAAAPSEGGSGEGGLLAAADLLEGQEEENWARANMLLDTVEPGELIGPEVHPTDLLVRLFHEEAPRVFDPQPLAFGCTCSEEKVRQSLSIYSARDISTMITEQGTLTADCQFCGAHYVLDPASVGFEAEAAAPEAQNAPGPQPRLQSDG